MTAITGTHSLTKLINATQQSLNISDKDLIQRAGLGENTLWHIRTKGKDTRLSTAAALLNELGYDIAAIPSGRKILGTPEAQTLDAVRFKIIDLRTSISNGRHVDDLLDEIDDILFWMAGK